MTTPTPAASVPPVGSRTEMLSGKHRGRRLNQLADGDLAEIASANPSPSIRIVALAVLADRAERAGGVD